VRVAIRVTCVLALGACGDAKSSTTEPEVPPAPAVVTTPKVEEALAAIVATCARCEATEVRRRGKPYWEPIAIGGTFRDGDWIRTQVNGSARIRFVSGGHLDLDEKTTLFVEADTAKRTAGDLAGVHVAMQSGGASGVLDGTKDAPLKIRTSDGEVRIAGNDGDAEFRLKPTADGAVEVAASKGQIVVKGTGGERRIEAGKPEPPKGPVAPKAPYVPPRPKNTIPFPSSTSPRIDARFTCLALLEIPLRWAAVPGATAYKVIVARDLSFRAIVAAKEVKDTSFVFRPPGPGTYTWRVAARDARGYGEFGFARRIFCEE
jgi:hypothetical protein